MVLKTYAFTIKKNVRAKDRQSVTLADYHDFLEELKVHGNVEFYEERDSKQRHHIHGLCNFDSKIKYSKLKPKGFSTLFKPCFDISKWLEYCKKDQKYAFKLQQDLTHQIMLSDYESQLGCEKPPDKKTEVKLPLRSLSLRQKDDQSQDDMIDPPDDFVIPKKKLF